MGKRVTPPATPDYAGAAVAQGAANESAARASAKLSNPNIIGPYGTQTVEYGKGSPVTTPGHWDGGHPDSITVQTPTGGWSVVGQDNPLSDLAVRMPDSNVQHFTGNYWQDQNLDNAFRSGGQILSNAGDAASAGIKPFQVNGGWVYRDPEGTIRTLDGRRVSASDTSSQTFSGNYWQDPNLDAALSQGGQILKDRNDPNAGFYTPLQMNGGWTIGGKGLDQFGERTWVPPSTTYKPGDPDVPTVTQSLTPAGQATVDEQQNAELQLSRIANQLAIPYVQNLFEPNGQLQFNDKAQKGLDLNGLPYMPVNAGTTGQAAIMERLNPSLARQRVSTETDLINQGLRPGDEAYNNAINLLGQQENDARTQAVLQGLGLDMSANQQGFGQALQSAQLGNSAIAQNLAQAVQLRQLPLNEINALMSGGQTQVPSYQAYQGASVAPAPVFAGVQNQAAWDQNLYNQQVAQKNALMQGLFGLGSAVTGGLFSLGRKRMPSYTGLG